MRVLAVTTWLPTRTRPHLGSFVLRDARALAEAGHEVALVHLVSPDQLGHRGRAELRSQDATPHGIPVTRVPMSTTNPYQIAAAGHRLSRWSAGADVVHTMAFSSLLALSWWRPHAPWVHTEHWSGLSAPHTLAPAHRVALPVLRPLLRRPDVVTTVTEPLAELVRAVRGERPTTVVPCVVTRSSSLAPRRPDPATLRMVCVGALVERKNPLLAVDTLAELHRRGVDAQLRFVGEGPMEPRVRSRADEHGLGDLVTFAGVRDSAGVSAELADADVFLGPTRGENFFVACAEAVLAGRPVVVGFRGGHPAYLDERVAVCVVEQDPVAFADAVGEVQRRSRSMSAEQVSNTIGERFSAATVATAYTAAYELASTAAPVARSV